MKRPRPIKAVIWDLGGVLVRTEDWQPRQDLADRLKMTRSELEWLIFDSESGMKGQLGLIDINQHLENVCLSLGLPLSEINAIRAGFWGGDRLDAVLVDQIRLLKLSFKIGLLSNQ